MLALEPLPAVRAVARPEALDAVEAANRAGSETPVSTTRPGSPGPLLRLAADELLAVGASLDEVTRVLAGDPHAIVVDEWGFSGAALDWHEYAARVAPHVEWQLPAARPALAQGLVAGVPAKLWCTTDAVLVVVATAYAHDLSERLP